MSCHSCNYYFQIYYDVTHVIEFTHLSFCLIDSTNDRLIRWTLRLQEYDITIKHKKGHLMQGPDALSRIYEANVVDCDSFDSCKEKIYNELRHLQTNKQAICVRTRYTRCMVWMNNVIGRQWTKPCVRISEVCPSIKLGFVGPLCRCTSDNCWILTIVDCYSKLTIIYFCRDATVAILVSRRKSVFDLWIFFNRYLRKWKRVQEQNEHRFGQ